MTNKTVVGILTDKAQKEGKSGEYFEYNIQEVDEKYPKTYRFFPKDEAGTIMGKAVKKEETVEATFWEKVTTTDGNSIVFRNIMTIKTVDAREEKPTTEEETVGKTSDDKKTDEHSKEIRLINVVDDTIRTAVMVREKWKTEFLQNEDMKDIPPEAKIATLNSLLIQVFKRI